MEGVGVGSKYHFSLLQSNLCSFFFSANAIRCLGYRQQTPYRGSFLLIYSVLLLSTYMSTFMLHRDGNFGNGRWEILY